MEQNPQNVVVTIPNATIDPPHRDESNATQQRPRKKMHVFKAALSMMGKRSQNSKALPVDDGSKSVWKKLVGSMRPMHLQDHQSPRASSTRTDDNGLLQLQITVPPPSLSEYNADGYYSPSPTSSRYASAVGLNEMVQGDEDGEIKQENNDGVVGERKEHGDGGGDGDEMIDAKAEEFIASFYKQMKLQRMDTMDRLYRERSHRSLGW